MTDALEDELPIDPAIAALRAVREQGLSAVLKEAGVREAVRRISILKHHPGARCTVLLEGPTGRLVFKAYAEDPAPIAAVLEVLSQGGLGSGRPPTVAPVEAFHGALRFLVFRWLAAPRARELLDDGAGDRVGELGAIWLRAARGIDAGLGRIFDPTMILEEARGWGAVLGMAHPDLGSAAANAQSALRATASSATKSIVAAGTEHGLRHGSFSPSHLFDLGGGPGLIDWDSFCRGPIELDAGNFLAVLSRIATAGARQWTEANRAARAFRAGLSGLSRSEALEWYRASMLVKHAKYVSTRRPRRWQARANALLAEAQSALRTSPSWRTAPREHGS